MPDLITMRLANMKLVHPQMATSTCCKCHEKVGIYPSGQRVLASMPNIKIVCHVCVNAKSDDKAVLAPGAEYEPFESVPAGKLND